MKNLTAIILWFVLLLPCSSFANNYYFSATGNDSRSISEAQSPLTPWRTLNKLQSILPIIQPGDSILFRRNDSFYGSLLITISGTAAQPVVFGAYGTGSNPVLTGLSSVSGWQPAGAGIWEASLQGDPDQVRQVLLNNAGVAIGRYPNTTEAEEGYLRLAGASGSGTVTMQGGTLQSGWTGAELIIRKNHWVLDRSRITSVNGSQLQFNATTGYNASAGNGYFIQDHPGTLDKTGEWYYNTSTHRLGMYFGTSGPSASTVLAAGENTIIRISNQSHLLFNNLSFEGSNEATIKMDQASHITFNACSIRFSGNTGISGSGCNNILVEGTLVDQSNNNAIDLSSTSNLTIRLCSITNTGMIKGSGAGDSGSYEALLLSGDNQLIEQNSIRGTGYIAVTFNGNDIVIRNNFIDSFGTVKDDGAGIYTWNNSANAPVHSNRIIEGNIILNGTGAPAGTDDRTGWMHGIYMDDDADHVTITNNTVAGCIQYGLFLHNAQTISGNGNTFFNNGTQVAMIHDHLAAPIRNTTFTDNICFSRTESQPVAAFRTNGNDIQSFGSINNNYYCRPSDENNPITASWQNGWGWYNLDKWKTAFGYDQQSHPSPVLLDAYHITSMNAASLFPNSSFNSGAGGIYAYASSGSAALNWSSNGPLDAGQLQLTFGNDGAADAKATLVGGIGPVRMGQQYILRYDIAGVDGNYAETYLRRSFANYGDLSDRKLHMLQPTRTSVEVLFTATADESNASIAFDIPAQQASVYLDNIRLSEASASVTNPDDSIRFYYNNSNSSRIFSLDGIYIDAKDLAYTGSITIAPWRSAVLIRKDPLLILPVSLSAFTAKKAGTEVLLTWNLDNKGEETHQLIERSADGSNFTLLGEQVAGISAGMMTYYFTDQDPLASNYYRIRYINGAGASSLSKTVHVRFEEKSQSNDFTISTDASQTRALVRLNGAAIHERRIVMTAADGKQLLIQSVQGTIASMDITSLPAGIYFVSVITEGNQVTKRFIKK